MSDDNQQMDAAEFRRAHFFSSDADFAAAKQRTDDARAARQVKRQARREVTKDIRALQHFVTALQGMSPQVQRAHIVWLADRFLGIKLPI